LQALRAAGLEVIIEIIERWLSVVNAFSTTGWANMRAMNIRSNAGQDEVNALASTILLISLGEATIRDRLRVGNTGSLVRVLLVSANAGGLNALANALQSAFFNRM